MLHLLLPCSIFVKSIQDLIRGHGASCETSCPEQTSTQRVGVLATQATFQGALYASVIERFANGGKGF